MLDKYMKSLSTFIKDEYAHSAIDDMFKECVYVNSMNIAERAAKDICYGNMFNLVFENSVYKNRFINVLTTLKPDINIINCNCSINSFFENDFNGFLVFNNLKHCNHKEIINEIKSHKGILIL